MKTNFKCMYLIDTHLYKKKILDEKTLLTHQPSVFHYSPPYKVPSQEIEKDKEASSSNTAPVLTENEQFQDFKTDSSKDVNNQKIQDSISKNDNISANMDCACSETNETVSGEKEPMNESLKKQCKAEDNMRSIGSKQRNVKKKRNKMLIPSISKNYIKKKTIITSKQKENVDEQNSDDELKERLYRLRYDYPDPNTDNAPVKPVKMSVTSSESKQNHHSAVNNGEEKINYVCTFCNEMLHSRHLLEKHISENHQTSYKKLKGLNRKPSLTDSKSITFVCTICENRFKRFSALSRHVKNIHPDYFEEWNRTKKRKSEIPHSLNKKFKHDGRQKRKLNTGEENELKKVKKEFRCLYCERFYKSDNALQRHINNLHKSAEQGKKRKNVNKQQHEGMYVKRKKGEPRESVQYINYF